MHVPVYDIKNCGPRHRFSANGKLVHNSDSINMQNLPSRGPNAGVIKCAILPPSGYVFIDCDSSQIEARTLAWLAGQDDLVEAFTRGEDVYRIMASAIYNKPVTEITDKERSVGKTTILGCIAEGTLVLCESGWKPIEQVTTADRLWDGVEWVCHQGLLKKGYKETVELCGSWLTPDHKILCGTEWRETQSVVQDAKILFRALATGTANLPLQGMYGEYVAAQKPLSCGATVEPVSTPSITTISKASSLRGAMYALKSRLRKLASCIGDTATYFRTTNIGNDYLTEYPVAYHGAIAQMVIDTMTMGGGGLKFSNLGEKTEANSYGTYLPWKTGKTLNAILTALTTVVGMNPVILGSQPDPKTHETSERSVSSRRNLMTYDLAYAGPRNRFTIATSAGPVIAHNCGYGMGAAKFKEQLRTFGVDVELDECQRIITVYRSTYPKIPVLWRECSGALSAMAKDQQVTIGRDGVLVVEGSLGVRLPNGLLQKYPNLRKEVDEESGGYEYRYDTKRGNAVVSTKIYGGKVVENICQALARIVIGEQMLEIANRHRVVMTVHDAVGCIAPEAEAESALGYVKECMRRRPSWAPDLPLDCKGSYAYSYGDCKD